jgi:CDGSH-type Zn-finger protein
VENLERLSNQKGAIDTKETMALCRCGGSANKPFCDGTHWHIQFRDDKN